ncbi:hypothetical protein AK830_g8111 [Neonectria ditissima]|uniref:Uncharacterized protein n=1 Tax=Neonectria ditissima TaxID=78410 RepID=A0A0P7BDG4_9HYPO|nr:hypothetical protein AK830_g8111 [Neonectria ditissima]
MFSQKTLIAPLLSLVASSAGSIIMSDAVPLLGPSFGSNFNISDSKAISDAKAAFPGLIENLFSTHVLNSTDTVFAIDVFSASTNESIYSYYHVGEGQNETLTSGELNDETIGRLGSVSKLFTVYAILAKAGIEIFSHPVIRYLPELAGNSLDDALQKIHWEDITVGALASHQAGTGGGTDLIVEYAEKLDELTVQVLLKFMRDNKHPVVSPFRVPAYSDSGFAVLGVILERLTGLAYEDAMEDALFSPLGLDSMTIRTPSGPDVNAINRIPIDNTSAWTIVVERFAPSGGLYANSADLRAAGLSILNSELLSPATTREWMKPHSGTGSLVELVGAPWEITRLAIPATPGSNRTRVSDLYTKPGGNGDYTCIFALSPDHGIGYSILVAGSTASSARWPLRDLVGETFIPAAEYAAAENAEHNFAGVFVDETAEGTNLTLTVDEGLPGLGLESFFIEGVDSRYALLGASEPLPLSTRLYSTGVTSPSGSLATLYSSKGTIRMSYRVVAMALPLADRAEVEGGKGGLFDNSFAWVNLGFFGAIDEFVFEIVDGRLVSVASSLTETTLKRVE